jgi:hypothetical protein
MDRIGPSDIAVLLSDGYRFGRPVQVVTDITDLGLARELEIYDERTALIDHYVAVVQIAVTHPQAVNRLDKPQDRLPHCSDLGWARLRPPLPER